MTAKNTSTRRAFLKNSAFLAVPLTVAVPAAVIADDGLKARLARLEDEAAIRNLHQDWLRQINTAVSAAESLLEGDSTEGAPTVRGIAADHAGQPDAIEVAADGKSAIARFHCIVETETAIPRDCTLAQMAHAQGDGFVRSKDRRILNVKYAKTGDTWAIAKTGFEQV